MALFPRHSLFCSQPLQPLATPCKPAAAAPLDHACLAGFIITAAHTHSVTHTAAACKFTLGMLCRASENCCSTSTAPFTGLQAICYMQLSDKFRHSFMRPRTQKSIAICLKMLPSQCYQDTANQYSVPESARAQHREGLNGKSSWDGLQSYTVAAVCRQNDAYCSTYCREVTVNCHLFGRL